MSKNVKQNIWLLCPHRNEKIAGYYEVDNLERYLLDQNGNWVRQRAYCFERKTCLYSSCVLCNRHHKGASGDFPAKIIPIGN